MTSSAAMYATLGEITKSSGGGDAEEEALEREADEKFWKAFRKGDNRWEELLVVFWKL